MASPELPLLRGSIGKNLRYRCRDASPEEIQRVWQLCGIDDLLAELPEGEKTRISEGGAGLSTGQRQRIALARAILEDVWKYVEGKKAQASLRSMSRIIAI